MIELFLNMKNNEAVTKQGMNLYYMKLCKDLCEWYKQEDRKNLQYKPTLIK